MGGMLRSMLRCAVIPSAARDPQLLFGNRGAIVPSWRRYGRRLESGTKVQSFSEVPVLCFRALGAILAAFWLIGSGCVIRAQGEKMPIQNCGNLATQAEMNDCAVAEAHKADVALNAAYRELLNKTRDNKTATERVVAAERAWVVFRDAELAAVWPVAKGENPNLLYGSVHPLCYYNELARMTWERVKTLKDLMSYQEGDVCSSGLAQRSESDEPGTCSPAQGKAKYPRSLNLRTHAAAAGQ
jgi:uncharacterized protein YecT (DUF1311 family)